MRTKSILTALCLPIAFTACTNDEFLSEKSSLDSRGKIDVVLTASKPDMGTDTRMSAEADGDGWKFVWEQGTDMLGAALVDGANVVDNNVYVNYPFVADQSGVSSTFSSKSSLTQGLYVFYYSYQDVLNRKGLPFGAPNQVFDASSTKNTVQQAINYMRTISPVINLANGVTYEKAQTYNLALKFANLYTPVTVKINSTNIPAGKAPKVTKVSLEKFTDNTYRTSMYPLNAAVDFTAMTARVNLNRNGEIVADQLEGGLTEAKSLIYAGTIYSANQADGVTAATTGAYTLDVVGDVTLENGNQTDLCILVPQGATQFLRLKVYTTEGVYTRDIDLGALVEFKENMKGIAANLNFAQDGSGNVILPGSFDIYTTEDWNNSIQFMTEHAVGYLNKVATFNLKDDVTINSLPIFNLTITGDTGAETLTLGSSFTFTDDNKDQFTLNNAKLAVGSGATLTIKKQPTSILGDITNWGTLVLAADLQNDIYNYGTLNVTADATMTGVLTNGRNRFGAITAETGSINVAAGKTLAIAGATSQNVRGTMTTMGAESVIDFQAAFTNAAAGNIVNNGILESSTPSAITNNGLIDNFGNLHVNVANNANIYVESGSRSGLVSDGVGTIQITGGTVTVKDINSFAALQSDNNTTYKKYEFAGGAVVTTEVTNAAEYAKADDRVNAIGITDITLNGGQWNLVGTTVNSTTSKDIAEAGATGMTGITLKDATLTMTVAGSSLTKTVTVSGTSVLKPATGVAATVTGDLKVNTGANFTVNGGITINSNSGNNETATINGKVTLEPKAVAYFKTATVGQYGELVVKGNSNDEGTPATFGVNLTSGSFINNGIVTSAASTKTTSGSKDPGVVSQPTNGATGTFNGNATLVPFS